MTNSTWLCTAFGLVLGTVPVNATQSAGPNAAFAPAYSVEQTWYDADGKFFRKDVGTLYFRDRVGFFIRSILDDDRPGEPDVFFVSDLSELPGVGLRLETGNVEYQGHRTTEGFEVAAVTKGSSGRSYTVMLTAKAIQLPPANRSGLYDMTSTTVFVVDGDRGDKAMDWTGTAAIALVRDTVHLSMVMNNGAGGDAGLSGSSPLASKGSFRIWMADKHKEFIGQFGGPGGLQGHWVVWTDSTTRFEGDASGTRF